MGTGTRKMDTRKLTAGTEVAGNAVSDAELSCTQQAFAQLFVAFVVALGLLLIERLLGGGWRNPWSFFCTVLLLWAGLLPVVFIQSGVQWGEVKVLGVGAVYGMVIGLVYGVLTRSLLPGAFFGLCLGHFVGMLLHLWRFKADTMFSQNGIRTGGAVAAAIAACHLLGVMTPTRRSRVESTVETVAVTDQQQEAAKPLFEEKRSGEKAKKESLIAADDLVNMNPVAASKLPPRITVTGRVMEMKTSTNLWGRREYEINISGDESGFQRKNARGYVEDWVECEFSSDAGLENIQSGQFVYVEGHYESNGIGHVVRLTKCRLSPVHHITD
jgi:hypothetical protein